MLQTMRPRWLSVESFGLILVLISAVLYAIAGAYVKLAHTAGLPSTELVFARGVFQGVLIVYGLYISKNDRGVRFIHYPFGQGPAQQRIVFWRGFLGGMGFLLDYHAMAVLPLGDAMTLMSLYPFLTIFLARIFLNEEIKPLHLVVSITSFLGAVFIGQPTFIFGQGDSTGVLSRWGYVTGLLGSVCLACILTLIRKGGLMGLHTCQLLLSWALFGLLFSVLIGPSYEGRWILPSTAQTWSYVAGVCVIGAGTHFMLNFSGKLAPAGLVSVVRASDILWAYVIEIYWFGQRPNTLTLVGVTFVLGSILAIAVEKLHKSRKLHKKLSNVDADNATSDEGYDIESPRRKGR